MDNQQPSDVIEVIIIKIVNCKYGLAYDYHIDEFGNVYSGKYKRKLTTHLDKNGYVKVRMVCVDGNRHTFSVHRLVAENFMPVDGMENLQVNHIDGNKLNNSLGNLEWCDAMYNVHHAVMNGLRNNDGEHNPSAKLTDSDVLRIFKLREVTDLRVVDIAEMFGVSASCIERVIYGCTFEYLQKYNNIKGSTTIS